MLQRTRFTENNAASIAEGRTINVLRTYMENAVLPPPLVLTRGLNILLITVLHCTYAACTVRVNSLVAIFSENYHRAAPVYSS